jgi:hypothetical protein
MGQKESTVEWTIEEIPETKMRASEAGQTTRLPDYFNANVYCKQSDPGTFGHQYGHRAEMTDCRHPIEVH